MIDPNSEYTSALRHLGSVVAGILITKGIISEGYTALAVVGFVVAVGTLLLAWWNKRTARQAQADTVAVALTLPASTRNDTLNAVLVEQNLPTVDLNKP